MSLIDRLGKSDDDSIAGFERAAAQRYRDAEVLRRANRRLSAIYLYGYAVEMWVKAAYFRAIFTQGGLSSKTQIDSLRRRMAENEWIVLGLPKKPGPHDIAGWAQSLVKKRIVIGAPHTQQLANEIINRATSVCLHWREYMRYRSVPIAQTEVIAVKSEANWFRSNYPFL